MFRRLASWHGRSGAYNNASTLLVYQTLMGITNFALETPEYWKTWSAIPVVALRRRNLLPLERFGWLENSCYEYRTLVRIWLVFSSDVVSLIAWVIRGGKSKQLWKGTGTRHNLFWTQSKFHIHQLSANGCVKRVNPWQICFGSCFQAEVFVQSESNKGHCNSRRWRSRSPKCMHQLSLNNQLMPQHAETLSLQLQHPTEAPPAVQAALTAAKSTDLPCRNGRL